MTTGQYKRKPHTKERKENISKSMKGKKKSLEARRNMSEAHKGKSLKHDGQFKDGHTAWNKGDKKYTRKVRRVNNKVISESHFVYMEYHQLKEIPKGFVIHHIDEDSLNNDIKNLRMMSKADHHFLHNALLKERYKFGLKVKKLKEELCLGCKDKGCGHWISHVGICGDKVLCPKCEKDLKFRESEDKQ